MNSFWSILDFLLSQRELTQDNFVKQCGIPLSTFNRWKNKDKLPKAESLIKMSEVLGVSLDFLLKGDRPDNLTLKIISAYPDIIKVVNKLSRNPEHIQLVIGYLEGKTEK